MPRGQDGFGISADFVGDFAGAAQGAIAAYDDQIDLVAREEQPGGVVCDHLVGDLLLGQFPGRQSGSL